jgi:tRNA A-37 threonylcarbamoyl transferase component Bud32
LLPSETSNMAQTTSNKTHILHFNYDDEDACALTILINDVRFHVIVEPKDLQKSREKPLYYEYVDKICGLRDAERREEEEVEKQQLVGKGNKKQRKSHDKDSAVDMTADDESDEDQDSESAAVELRNWILSAFADVTATWAPPNREPVESTLHEWYHGPTYFYSLQIKAGQLEPELLETTEELENRIEDLVPRLKMPKYIQNIDVPWIDAHDLTVQSEVSHPEPAHPGQVVDEDGNVYFFKPVVADQPGPVKREIQILQQIEKADLDIKAPKLIGFVGFESSKAEAMGYLMTPIKEPRPLTHFLKSSVPREKRAEWANKSEEYVKALHSHGIVWGDAKADNFIVDANDELWIIDFGGSYTDGWVDPELSETREGDDMGVEKVVKALEDPEKNTFDPGVETTSDTDTEIKETASSLFVTEKVKEEGSGKRKRNDEDEYESEDEEKEEGHKRRREDSDAEE